MSDKGRWFRVYARQIEEHPKFREMSGLELGAWLALRSAAELRDRAIIRDWDEAVLILKRRRLTNPKAMLQRLVDLTLFDVEEGRVHVHDRADHDRPQYPSDSAEAVAERKRRSRSEHDGHEYVTTRDEQGHDTHAGVQPQPPSPAPANSTQPQPSGDGLPDMDDSATLACRFFLNGGQWLGNSEYVAGWEEMDRRFGDWVKPEIPEAYRRLHEQDPKVKPWSLLRAVEMALAERARLDELAKERAEAEASRADRQRIQERLATATEEDKRRAEITRRAIGLWIKNRPSDPVPTDFGELEAWLNDNDKRVAA